MKSRGLSLKLITVLAVTSVLFGVSSCHVNFTVESSSTIVVSSSLITDTSDTEAPSESTTELGPILAETTATVTTEEETTTATTTIETTEETVIENLRIWEPTRCS